MMGVSSLISCGLGAPAWRACSWRDEPPGRSKSVGGRGSSRGPTVRRLLARVTPDRSPVGNRPVGNRQRLVEGNVADLREGLVDQSVDRCLVQTVRGEADGHRVFVGVHGNLQVL